MVCRGSHAMHGHFLKRLQSYTLFCNKPICAYVISKFQQSPVFDNTKKMCYLCMLNSRTTGCSPIVGNHNKKDTKTTKRYT